MNTKMPTLAFLGIGLMGKPMAARLLEAGYAVSVWNRNRDKAEALLPLGAQVAAKPDEAVAQVDIVITML